jgi:hypothetical protein
MDIDDSTYILEDIVDEHDHKLTSLKIKNGGLWYFYNDKEVTSFIKQWLEESKIGINDMVDSDKFILLIKLQEKFGNKY